MKKIYRCLILIFTAFTILGGLAQAAEKEIVFKDWALRQGQTASDKSKANPNRSDSKKLSWILEQRVYIQGSEESPLIHMGFQFLDAKEGKQNRRRIWITMRVPLGVMLAPGLKLQVDGHDPIGISLHHCRETGCIALMPLENDMRTALEAGITARVTFQLLSGQAVGIPISLMGIKAGLAGLDKKMAQN